MSQNLKGSITEGRLIKAFAGESMARNRYTYYSEIAKKEGYEQISGIFLETAGNEVEHARRFFSFLGEENTPLVINDASYPIGLSKTDANLAYAAFGEHEEHTLLYPESARIAKEEGFDMIAKCFLEISEIEKVHEQRFIDLRENLIYDKVFKRDNEQVWKCRNCGYHHIGNEAPQVCPGCLYPRAHYELYCKNF